MMAVRLQFWLYRSNFPNPGGEWDTAVIIYGYTPSFVLAVIADVFFWILLFFHIWQVVRYRSWLTRIISYNYFILNYFFIVTAPVFLAAGIYTILSALILRLGRQFLPVPPKVVLWFFITSDAVATIAQISGAELIGVKRSRREDPTTANNILLGGLAYQRAINEQRLMTFVTAFAAATMLVYLRTCFRLAETSDGLGGKLSSNEIYFGALEFALVVLAVILLLIWHPGRCVARKVSRGNEDVEKMAVGSNKSVQK
ncbi:RTA1 like protein [Colletotrichum somersetense]|nr:RTA1 like protein [Colletotrichum somersetense]